MQQAAPISCRFLYCPKVCENRVNILWLVSWTGHWIAHAIQSNTAAAPWVKFLCMSSPPKNMRVLQFLTAVLLSQLTLTPRTKKSNALSLKKKNCNSCSDFLMLVEMARGSLVLWSVLILQSCHLFGKCLAALEDACDCDAVEIVTTTDVVLRKHGQLLGRYGLKGDKT